MAGSEVSITRAVDSAAVFITQVIKGRFNPINIVAALQVIPAARSHARRISRAPVICFPVLHPKQSLTGGGFDPLLPLLGSAQIRVAESGAVALDLARR